MKYVCTVETTKGITLSFEDNDQSNIMAFLKTLPSWTRATIAPADDAAEQNGSAPVRKRKRVVRHRGTLLMFLTHLVENGGSMPYGQLLQFVAHSGAANPTADLGGAKHRGIIDYDHVDDNSMVHITRKGRARAKDRRAQATPARS